MNKSEKKIRLAMIKAIGERRKIEIENKKLKGIIKNYSDIIKSLINCGNCGNLRKCGAKEKLKCTGNNYRDWIIK
jgi:hypothetical protein